MSSKFEKLETLLDRHIIRKDSVRPMALSRRESTFLSPVRQSADPRERMANINLLRTKRLLLKTGTAGISGILLLLLMCFHDNEASINRNDDLTVFYLYFLFGLTVCFAVFKALSVVLYNQLLMEEELISRRSSVLSRRVFFVLLVYLVHPTVLFHGIKIDSWAAFPEVHFQRALNDYLLIFQVSVLFIEALKQFIFHDAGSDERAKILVRKAKFEGYIDFFLKYSFKKHPLAIVLKFIVFGTLYLSFLLRVAESPPEISSESFLDYWCNAVYLAFVTMLTIGYGDYTPRSFLGRFVAVIMGIFGFVFFSLIITAIDSVKNFSRRERLIFMNIEEIYLKKQITTLAASVMGKLARCYLKYQRKDARGYFISQKVLENELIRFKEARIEFADACNYAKYKARK